MSEVASLHDRKEAIHQIRYSPDGTLLAVASNDGFVDVYGAAQRHKRLGVCSKSASFVTHVDWSTDGRHLQTNDGAGERIVYQMPNGKPVSGEAAAEVKWATWTCVLGPEVSGVWPKYARVSDVNAIDSRGELCASGDDFGTVKLFRFPTIREGARCRRYGGHSAHVTNVKFTAGGGKLMTTGGADRALFQWRLVDGDVIDDVERGDGGGGDSVSEGSDSDLSDVAEVDSDIEHEAQVGFAIGDFPGFPVRFLKFRIFQRPVLGQARLWEKQKIRASITLKVYFS